MAAALEEARAAADAGDVPVGAVIVRGNEILARSSNHTVRDQDTTAHSLGRVRAALGAIVLARLDRVVFGAWDDKAGMAGSVGDLLRHPRLNHRPDVLAGVRGDECAALLRRFFGERRVSTARP